MNNIFVTGGTGLLGAELIKCILTDTDDMVYTLVRAEDKAQATDETCHERTQPGDQIGAEIGAEQLINPTGVDSGSQVVRSSQFAVGGWDDERKQNPVDQDQTSAAG